MIPRPRFIRDKRRATIAPGIRGPIPARASRALTMANRLRSYPPFKHHGIEALGRADQGDREVIMIAEPHESESGTTVTNGDDARRSTHRGNPDIAWTSLNDRL